MQHILRLCFCLMAVFSLTACVGSKGVDVTRFGLADAVISRDLEVFPQDLMVYAERAGKDTPLMDSSRQGREDARFDANFFAAWDARIPLLSKADVFEGVENMDPARGFAENLRPWSKERWDDLVANCFMEAYGGSSPRPAITVGDTALRRMPTDAPYFLDPNKGGEGFPFDYMQNSVLWVGTPVAVTHVSRDRMWVFVQTSLVSGWAKATDLAAVDRVFIKAWRSRPLAVIVKDNTELSVRGAKSDAVTGSAVAVKAHVGTVLPFATVNGTPQVAKSPHVFVHVPLRGGDGKVIMATAFSPMYATWKKPVYLTPGNIALVGNAMMGQPYGWGGLFSQRDCSSAMRDLFTPFGVWLPRNSRAQGRMGTRLELDGLTPDAKEEKIMRDGTPFFSLVSMPGHVGLYLGSYPMPEPKSGPDDPAAVPVMFHTLWGLRVVEDRGADKREGRAVIGKAVVTSLRPGAEHETISSPASILDRVGGLAVFPEPLADERGGR